MIAEGLRLALSRWPSLRVVGTASTVSAAARLAARRRANVALIDAGLGEPGGPEIAARIRATAPHTRIILLVPAADRNLISAGRRAGVSAFLGWQSSRPLLSRAIAQVLAGQEFIDPELAAQVLAGTPGERLTDRELQVLALMADGHANGEIATSLDIGEETVKTYVKRILAKLGARSRTHAVATALRDGVLH